MEQDIIFFKYEKLVSDRMKIECEKHPDPSHDFSHVLRVVNLASKLAQTENANLNIVLPAAYLHDVVIVSKTDSRRKQASQLSADEAVLFLKSIHYPDIYLDEIHHAILAHSFSAGVTAKTIEAKVVQDADRLDGIGAIGVARCFALGGKLNRTFYDQSDMMSKNRQFDDQKYTLDHFFVKLLKVADMLNTSSAKAEGKKRTDFLNLYLNQLSKEIE